MAAICFATACIPSALGVRRLSELRSNGSEQVKRCLVQTSIFGCCVSMTALFESRHTLQPCEVCLELRGQDSTVSHKLCTTLAPDGSRVHKLNDKTKTAKELKVHSQATKLLKSSILERGTDTAPPCTGAPQCLLHEPCCMGEAHLSIALKLSLPHAGTAWCIRLNKLCTSLHMPLLRAGC